MDEQVCEVVPKGGRIVVELAKEEVTASGIVLVDSAQEKPQHGKILAVSPPWKDPKTGASLLTEFEVGDTVIFAKYGGTSYKLKDGREVSIMRETDVLGVIL
jgi:chaperonin GroES